MWVASRHNVGRCDWCGLSLAPRSTWVDRYDRHILHGAFQASFDEFPTAINATVAWSEQKLRSVRQPGADSELRSPASATTHMIASSPRHKYERDGLRVAELLGESTCRAMSLRNWLQMSHSESGRMSDGYDQWRPTLVGSGNRAYSEST